MAATDSNMPIQCHIAVMFWHIKNTNWFAPVAMASSRNANAKTPGGPGAARPQWSEFNFNQTENLYKPFPWATCATITPKRLVHVCCRFAAVANHTPARRNCEAKLPAWQNDCCLMTWHNKFARNPSCENWKVQREAPPSISISMVLDKSDSMRWGNVNIFREGG